MYFMCTDRPLNLENLWSRESIPKRSVFLREAEAFRTILASLRSLLWHLRHWRNRKTEPSSDRPWKDPAGGFSIASGAVWELPIRFAMVMYEALCYFTALVDITTALQQVAHQSMKSTWKKKRWLCRVLVSLLYFGANKLWRWLQRPRICGINSQISEAKLDLARLPHRRSSAFS